MANSLQKHIYQDSNREGIQTYDPVKKEERLGCKHTKLGWIPEEWEIIKLGDVGEFKNGINKGKEDFGFGVPFINLMDVFGKPVLLQDNWDLVNANQSEIDNYSLKKGDVLFIRSSVKTSGVGLTSIVKEDVPNTVYSGFLIRYRINKEGSFNNDFLQYCFYEKGFRQRLIVRSSSSANTNINQDNLKQLLINRPPLPEQQKIATILSTWDAAIAKQQQLIAAKQQYKKGLMQLLLTGKLRFDGFEEKWNKTELREIGTIIRGASPRPKGDPRYYGGNVPRLMVKDVTRDGKYVTPKIDYLTEAGAEKSRPCKAGTLTIVCSGDVGVPSFLAVDACIHDGFLAIIDIRSTLINSDFLYYQLKRLRTRMERSATHGGVFTNLTTNILKDFIIEIPSVKEQLKIINILSKADKEVDKQELKLIKLLSQKQGLMRQLLTGQKRVKI